MGTIKKKFEAFVKRNNIKLYDNLSDVTKANIELAKGDQIMFINSYGLVFGPYKVLGFQEPSKYGNCIYFEHMSYWYPCEVAKVEKIIKKLRYKNHDICVTEDAFMQRFTRIVSDDVFIKYPKRYASIEDAKRVIRGEQPKYVIN